MSVPNAVGSERAVLHAAMLDPMDFIAASQVLSDDDWFLPQHQAIWSVMRSLHTEGTLEAGTVRDKIGARHPNAMQALLDLFGTIESGSLSYHCDRVAATATFRALLRTGQRLVQIAESSQAVDTDPIALAESTIDRLRVVQRMGTAEAHTEMDLLDVIERPRNPGDYVVPGLLARGNRIVITAPEGYGKSSLLRQIGCCAAAGVHPFKPAARIRPVNVLIIDAENPEEINTDEYRRVTNCLNIMDRMAERDSLYLEECGPINLLSGREAARIYTLVERRRPDLVIIGPIYQLHEENPNDEGPARKLSAVLDRIRRISGAALVTEAHTPHSDGPNGQMLRPYGASLWKRWPEFGYCLHPVTIPKDRNRPTDDEMASIQARESLFTPWRGSRAVRDWPSRLRLGHVLPWVTQ